eukprot:6206716-Pleurochrysis_carterae.AAC.1
MRPRGCVRCYACRVRCVRQTQLLCRCPCACSCPRLRMNAGGAGTHSRRLLSAAHAESSAHQPVAVPRLRRSTSAGVFLTAEPALKSLTSSSRAAADLSVREDIDETQPPLRYGMKPGCLRCHPLCRSRIPYIAADVFAASFEGGSLYLSLLADRLLPS